MKQVITKGPDENYLETDDGLKPISIEEVKAITGFDNVEEVELGGQVLGTGKHFETNFGSIVEIDTTEEAR
jgi:hypothetical protein